MQICRLAGCDHPASERKKSILYYVFVIFERFENSTDVREFRMTASIQKVLTQSRGQHCTNNNST